MNLTTMHEDALKFRLEELTDKAVPIRLKYLEAEKEYQQHPIKANYRKMSRLDEQYMDLYLQGFDIREELHRRRVEAKKGM